jgi:hypothetical protein
VRKNLERLVRYSNLNKKTDFTHFDAHYTLFYFVPLVMDFLAGKIATPEDLIKQYLNMIKDVKEEISHSKLREGVQQFRLMIAMSRMSQFVSQDRAAQLWVRAVGGEDSRLPMELANKLQQGRKREDKAGDKGLEEEKKENPERQVRRIVDGQKEDTWKGPNL